MPRGRPSKRTRMFWNNRTSQKRKLLAKLLERDGPDCCHCGVETIPAPAGDAIWSDDRQRTIDHHPVPKRDLPVSEWFNPAHCKIGCRRCNLGNNDDDQTRRTE